MSENVEIRVDNTKIVVSQMNDAILKALEAVGQDVQKIAYENAPHDTGRLRDSITHAVDNSEKAVYIGTNVEYSGYQELGTSRMSAANEGRGYLRPAVTDNKARIRAIFEEELKNA